MWTSSRIECCNESIIVHYPTVPFSTNKGFVINQFPCKDVNSCLGDNSFLSVVSASLLLPGGLASLGSFATLPSNMGLKMYTPETTPVKAANNNGAACRRSIGWPWNYDLRQGTLCVTVITGDVLLRTSVYSTLR